MKYIIILFIIAGAGFYLHWAYVRIYTTIGKSAVTNQAVHQVVDVGSSSAVKKITYVALGDSLTAGVGAAAADKTYPYQLGQLLADAQSAQVRVVNLAWPGATAADVLKNQVPQVSQFNPDIITVAIGTNDMHNRVSAHEFQRTISAIVDAVATSTTRV